MYRKLIFAVLASCFITAAFAKGVYQEPKAFLAEVFSDQVPKSNMIWLTGEVGKVAARILHHKPKSLRIRYWLKNTRSVWILEEIGKVKPITVGIVISNDAIEQIKVLVFRESRGWEVRHPFFTDQFALAGLNSDYRLDRSIDGISGATLSVRALTSLAQLALYLHQKI